MARALKLFILLCIGDLRNGSATDEKIKVFYDDTGLPVSYIAIRQG